MTRRFAPTPLDVAEVVGLLDTARRAPSAGFSQGTHFLLLTGDNLAEFWRVSGCGRWFADRQPGVLEAPAVVLPLADPQAYLERYATDDKAGHGLEQADGWPVPFWLTDTAMAAQNLLLLAEEHRLGALYFGIFRNERRTLDTFGVPSHMQAVGAIALGRRADDDSPSGSASRRGRRAVHDVVHLERW